MLRQTYHVTQMDGAFSQHANPSGVLEFPQQLDDKQVADAKEKWKNEYGDMGKSGVAVLGGGLKYHTITIHPEQAQFLETRKFQLNEIARIFRVPPHMIGDLEKSSFSNIEQQSLEFVKYTLDPWVVRWEQALEQALLMPSERGTYSIKLNVDGLLRGDYQSRMAGYATGIQNGFLSPNDVRRLENMNPVPGGDVYVLNGNVVRLEDAGAAFRS